VRLAYQILRYWQSREYVGKGTALRDANTIKRQVRLLAKKAAE
jgi:hypothetical protein